MAKKKIAIVGSGISGLSAAYLLSKKYEVHLYEKNTVLGGHTRTIIVNEQNSKIPIDTGFIVFNEINYPDLINFFKILNIKSENSSMSFAVSSLISNIEYSGKNLISLFCNPNNIFSSRFLNMLFEIYRLYKICNKIELDSKFNEMTLFEFLDYYKFSNYIRKYHIYPLISSIWSSNENNLNNFPLISFINFFKNHGLFKLSKRPQWKYVLGGSNEYIKKIIHLNLFNFYTNTKIKNIQRLKEYIEIEDTNENKKKFDKLILATHADQALSLLNNPTKKEKDLLSKFTYSNNQAYLHSDSRLMPKRKLAWSSWNFIENSKNNFTLTYWMNLLQNLPTKNNYFVTINPHINPKKILDKTTFHHPIFTNKTLKAQKEFCFIQGTLNTFYCGSYLGYGFHEDGIQSSVYIAKLLGIDLPWLRNKKFYNRLNF